MVEIKKLDIKNLKRIFSTWQWVTILGCVVSCSVGAVKFAYATFEMKQDHDKFESRVENRIDSLEKRNHERLERMEKTILRAITKEKDDG